MFIKFEELQDTLEVLKSDEEHYFYHGTTTQYMETIIKKDKLEKFIRKHT